MKLNFRESETRYRPVLFSFALLLLLAVLALRFSVPGQLPATGDPTAFAALEAATPGRFDFGRIPLSFEANQGQTDSQVRFLARGPGYGLFLTSNIAFLSLHSHFSSNSVVGMQLAGANPGVPVKGLEQLPGRSNYLIGNDPAKWHRDIPQFARVRYEGVYPGVNLAYYGRQGQLEYDFEVAPGADPSRIKMRFPGAEKTVLQESGDLILTSGQGELRLKAPRIYQSDGKAQQTVEGRFALRPDGEVGFELGAYDRRRALVIDPVLTFSTYFGGSGNESCSLILTVPTPPSGCPAVAIDASSNVYVAGSTTSADLPVVPPLSTPPPAFQTALAVAPDVFVTKINGAGNTIIFSTYLGGNGVDTTAGLVVDSAFNVIVAGNTTSTNFPTSAASAFQTTPASAGAHAFVSELDPTGETLPYSTYLSGNGTESARGLALDPRNKIYVIGTTTSTNQPDATHSFPATIGAIQVASLGTSQFFLSKIDPTLIGPATLPYSTYFGGGSPVNGVTLGGAIAVDANSVVYITGGTNFQHTGSATTDFPILNAYQACLDTPPPLTAPTTVPPCSTTVTAPDAFVAKINPAASSGSQLLYSTYLGGTGDDVGYGIAVDSGLSAYVTGSTTSPDFTIPSGVTPLQRCLDNPTNPSPCPAGVTASDAFVGKFGTPCVGTTCTTTAVPFTYFSYLGGSGADAGLGIAVDSLQGARLTGWTNSADFPVPNHPVQATLGGLVDAFVARVDTTASSTLSPGHYGTYMGGSGNDFGTSIVVDAQGSSYAVGETASPNFPVLNPIQANIDGPSDIFLTKLGPVLNLSLTEAVSPNPAGVGNNVIFTYTITNNGDLTTGIIFTDLIPSTATFVSASSSPGQTSCPAPTTSTTVTCTIGTLNGGAVATVEVVVAPVLPATPVQPGSVSDGGKITIFGTGIVVTPGGPPAVATVNNFGISVSPATATEAAGIPASFTVTVTPTGNIPDTVTLSASGAPTGGTTTFPNGATFTNLSSGPQSRQLVVNTTARVTTPASLFPSGRPFYAAIFPVSGLALLGAGIGGRKSRRRRALMTVLLGCFFSLMLFQLACSSSSSTSTTTGTPAGTYNLTVTATSGTATRTQQVVLVVQ